MPDYKKTICLAVDDEPLALNVIQKHITCVPSLSLAATCNNAIEAVEKLQQHRVDLLFLDIQMPQILGTDFIRSLKHPPKVIFTTAYRKFAIEGFELNAVDYLLKPISFERFLKAVNKVMEPTLHLSDSEITPAKKTRKTSDSYLFFRADRKMMKVMLSDIQYIESLKDYIKVVTDSKTIITKQPISSLEQLLPKDGFVRIHRCYIVALDRIESYTNESIILPKKELPISRMYKNEVRKLFHLNP